MKSVQMTQANAAALHSTAHAAGLAAASACVPVPMTVQQRENPLDDNSAIVYQERVNDGVCGFAWIEVRPARGGFATYARNNAIGKYSEYSKCVRISVPLNTQSYEIKMAYASAYANVLAKMGIDAYGNGRLD